jgi:hypothetical protein
MGARITVKGDTIEWYDASNNKIRVDKAASTTWYNTAGDKIREDTCDHVEFFNAAGNRIAIYAHDECGVFQDASSYVYFAYSGLTVHKSGSMVFSFGDSGTCTGNDGTHAYTLDPSVLSNNASFQATDVCDSAGTSAKILRGNAA